MKYRGRLEELHALCGMPGPASTRQEAPRVTPECRRITEAAPFPALATGGPERARTSMW